ncbi:Fungal specific transcription factor [Pleurostoma richardsiae]|uniref:Fungal specific transcription factor n=1 Tax=Pleurostoma richardsiae TaxID=41990 RepID=A0AA38RSP4_9PEZI|nr:Fungal specific transcription factor [Pleurostoma richardsiae]
MDDAENLARQACLSCRKQKRKCTRGLPSCELCRRNRRLCDYPADALRPNQSSSSGVEGITNCFPAIFFLDSYLFQRRRYFVSMPQVALPREFAELLDPESGLEQLLGVYFETVHPLFPIVSRFRLTQDVAAGADPGPDKTFLMLTIRLLVENAAVDETAAASLYKKAKLCYSYLEASGVISLRVLQGLLLLSYHELANAIYPAAYLTVGVCARLGHTLGYHDRRNSPQPYSTSVSWREVEEIRRTWWGVLVLDRYASLGLTGRPFSRQDAKPLDLLPMDEKSWEDGEPTVIPSLAVSADASRPASSFTRTCQASHLLSRVLKHVNEKPTDVQTWYQEALQLHGIVQAFTTAVSQEMRAFDRQADGTSLCRNLLPALGLCYSTQLSLYDVHTCADADDTSGVGIPEQLRIQDVSLNGMKSVCFAVVELASKIKVLPGPEVTSSVIISPLVAHCLYESAKNVLWYAQETGKTDYVAAATDIQDCLRMIGESWAVGSRYIEILNEDDLRLL